MLINTCLIIILLAVIVWQDFTDRTIYWVLLPVLAACLLLKTHFDGTLSATNICINLCIVSLQVGLLSIYIYIKNKKWELCKNYLGWGDILFFCALAVYFSTPIFLGFQIASLLLTLIGFIILKTLNQRLTNIPLAGCQASFLILLITSQSVFDFSDSDIHWYLNHYILGYGY